MHTSYREGWFGEVERLLLAYAGMPADDTADRVGTALEAWVRQTWRLHPQAIAVAARQIRELLAAGGAHIEADEVRRRLPDLGLAPAERDAWLAVVARHLERVADEALAPPAAVVPATHWEWRARFPELAQLLGGWFSQDADEEFADHDAALADYSNSTSAELIARLVGEVHELLALPLEEGEVAMGLMELGMETEPPSAFTSAAWLARLVDTVTRMH